MAKEDGYEDMGRMTTLVDLARKHGWRKGAEIGVWEGHTLFHLLDQLPDLTMYAVDQYLPFRAYAKKDMNGPLQRVQARLVNYPNRVTFLRMESVAASMHVADGELDFVFIDADHETDSVFNDLSAWVPKVKAGGSVTGHDVDWPTVQAGLKLFGQTEYATLPGRVWHYQKA